MDLSKLTTGDKVIVVSGILLFVFSFLTWFEASSDTIRIIGDATRTAWGIPLGILGVLAGLALAVFTLLPALGVSASPKLSGGRLAMILGSATFVAILIVFLFSKLTVEGQPDDAVDTSRKIGAFLGIVAAAGVLGGAILKRKEGGAFTPPSAPPAA